MSPPFVSLPLRVRLGIWLELGIVLGSSLVLAWFELGSSLVRAWFVLDSSLVRAWFELGASLVRAWFLA